MILTIRTDNPEAEVGLFEGDKQVAYKKWQAHRELGETIHTVIAFLLKEVGSEWKAITGIIYYKGPGSFTGLRIGAAVSNALASSLSIPVVNASKEDWIETGLSQIEKTKSGLALPEYGADPHITIQKK